MTETKPKLLRATASVAKVAADLMHACADYSDELRAAARAPTTDVEYIAQTQRRIRFHADVAWRLIEALDDLVHEVAP